MKRAILSWHSGFTLVEMMVVVALIGILMLIGIPQYLKSIEAAKADDAAALLKIIGTTNRMYNLDNNAYADGTLDDNCNSTAATACADNSPPNKTPGKGCALLYCRYIATQNWTSKSYNFVAMDGSVNQGDKCALGATAGNYVACAGRKNLPHDCPTGTSQLPCTGTQPYASWGYTIDTGGTVTAWNGAPPISS